MSKQRDLIKVLSAGIFSLILVLGVARFSYTPLLPIMQHQAGLGVAAAGWLAAINYAGYLSGALIATMISDMVLKDRLYRIGMILAILSTAMMGMTTDFTVWALSRFVAGLSSAAGLLLGSGLILNWRTRHRQRSCRSVIDEPLAELEPAMVCAHRPGLFAACSCFALAAAA